MSAVLLSALLLAQAPHPPPAQPSSQPSSQPATLIPGGTGQDLRGTVTLIFEAEEQALKIQESWSLENGSGKRVEPQSLVFDYPPGTKRLTLSDGITGFAIDDGRNTATLTEALGPGRKDFAVAYILDRSGSRLTIRRGVPVSLSGARLILEQMEGLRVTANVPLQHRNSSLNGLEFAIYEMGALPPGSPLELNIEGLPSRTGAPRAVATAVASAILLGSFFLLGSARQRRRVPLAGALSAAARRDQIVKAIELLERDFKSDKIPERRYQKRHGELVEELATVLRELEQAERAAGALGTPEAPTR